jgi:hypothetical protein
MMAMGICHNYFFERNRKMKDFNDFLKLLDKDMILAITDDVNQKVAGMPADATDSTKNGVAAFTIATELLGIYHKWLFE